MKITPQILTRRAFLRSSLASCAGLGGLGILTACSQPETDPSTGLLPANEHGLRLPEGFRSRIVARSSQLVGGSNYHWHGAPDGGAVFPVESGGWIYVSNSELDDRQGSVGALRFDKTGEITDAYSILSSTTRNCAGGTTPWGTWLSCEEFDEGQVWECDPTGETNAIHRPALGTFNHEAVAVDPDRQILYLTEDERDGRLYRYVPGQLTELGYADLSSGHLEVASVNESGQVSWLTLPDPLAQSQPTRHQVSRSSAFNGGEGIIFANGKVVFTTKGDNRVWSLDVNTQRISVLYDPETYSNPILSGVDNVALTPMGNYAVAEDGGDMQIVVVTGSGELQPLLQIIGQDESEICGPAFSPDWSRLYFSSQRGTTGRSEDGITYEITGPFAV